MKKIIALASSYNRKDHTMRALESLYAQELPEGYQMEVCLLDDGSADGTAEAVAAEFPRTVLIRGTGQLYWAGGMEYAYEKWVRHQDFDFLLVFNDDIRLKQGALKAMINNAEKISENGVQAYSICGCFMDPEKGEISYGGYDHASWWHPLRFRIVPPDGTVKEVITINMNFTLISRAALDKTGFLRNGFVHNKADFDFGLNLRKEGGKNFITPEVIGECSVGRNTVPSMEKDISLRERWKRFLSVKEESPYPRYMLYRSHGGWLWPVLWMLPYVKMTLISVYQVISRLIKKIIK